MTCPSRSRLTDPARLFHGSRGRKGAGDMRIFKLVRTVFGIWFIFRVLFFIVSLTVGLAFTAGPMVAIPVAGSLVVACLIALRLASRL